MKRQRDEDFSFLDDPWDQPWTSEDSANDDRHESDTSSEDDSVPNLPRFIMQLSMEREWKSMLESVVLKDEECLYSSPFSFVLWDLEQREQPIVTEERLCRSLSGKPKLYHHITTENGISGASVHIQFKRAGRLTKIFEHHLPYINKMFLCNKEDKYANNYYIFYILEHACIPFNVDIRWHLSSMQVPETDSFVCQVVWVHSFALLKKWIKTFLISDLRPFILDLLYQIVLAQVSYQHSNQRLNFEQKWPVLSTKLATHWDLEKKSWVAVESVKKRRII